MKKASLLLLLGIFFISSCNKKTNVPPEQDTDVSHVQDVMFANSFMADLACITIQSNNGDVYMPTYSKFSGTLATSDVSINTNTTSGLTTVSFNSVTCADGVFRNGSIQITASPVATLSMPKYPGYAGTVQIQPGFVVKNYSVIPLGPIVVKNITPNGFVPSQTPMKWEISGNVQFKDTVSSSSGKDFTWNGKFTMTFANSTNTLMNNTPTGNFNFYLPVFTATMTAFPTPTNAALMKFNGTITGKVKTSTNYTFAVRSDSELEKNFNKTPNYAIAFRKHPFVSGKADLKIDGKSTRYIDLGDGSIDESGQVQINSLYYRFEFTY